jgi:hypothetical protein
MCHTSSAPNSTRKRERENVTQPEIRRSHHSQLAAADIQVSLRKLTEPHSNRPVKAVQILGRWDKRVLRPCQWHEDIVLQMSTQMKYGEKEAKRKAQAPNAKACFASSHNKEIRAQC